MLGCPRDSRWKSSKSLRLQRHSSPVKQAVQTVGARGAGGQVARAEDRT